MLKRLKDELLKLLKLRFDPNSCSKKTAEKYDDYNSQFDEGFQHDGLKDNHTDTSSVFENGRRDR
jgi:hypothetical protein